MNHRPYPVRIVQVVSFSLSLALLTFVGCGSESIAVSQAHKSELTKAREQAVAAEASLKDAKGQARLLAVKIESLVSERNALQQERDELLFEAAKAGEKFAAVQTQFSDLRARSAEFNSALESLSQIISGTDDEDMETGISIIPRDVEKIADARSDDNDSLPTLYGPPELPGSNTATSVFAVPDPAADAELNPETETEPEPEPEPEPKTDTDTDTDTE